MVAVTVELLTKVVERFDPFQRTTEFETNFVPVNINVKFGPPAEAEEGDSALIVGTGFVGDEAVLNTTSIQ